jgi:hypothetical protein
MMLSITTKCYAESNSVNAMLSVIMLSVIILNVVAPYKYLWQE